MYILILHEFTLKCSKGEEQFRGGSSDSSYWGTKQLVINSVAVNKLPLFVLKKSQNISETAEISMRPLKHRNFGQGAVRRAAPGHASVVSRKPEPTNNESTTHWSSQDNPAAKPSTLSLATRGLTSTRVNETVTTVQLKINQPGHLWCSCSMK